MGAAGRLEERDPEGLSDLNEDWDSLQPYPESSHQCGDTVHGGGCHVTHYLTGSTRAMQLQPTDSSHRLRVPSPWTQLDRGS